MQLKRKGYSTIARGGELSSKGGKKKREDQIRKDQALKDRSLKSKWNQNPMVLLLVSDNSVDVAAAHSLSKPRRKSSMANGLGKGERALTKYNARVLADKEAKVKTNQ